MLTVIQHKKLLMVIALLLQFVVCSQVLADHGGYSGQFKSVHTLLEHSSAAAQIESSGDSLALEKYAQARAQFSAAVQASDKGDNETAKLALREATKFMFEAVKQADRQSVITDKQQADFSNRKESIIALLEAHGRISAEKGEQQVGAELSSIVNQNLATAQELFDRGKYTPAKSMLDDTYVATKTAIEKQRGGDTLVRSLNFASSEEEYHYELDRNQTHRMLVRVLLDKKMQDPATSDRVGKFLKQADEFEDKATQQADAGDYAAAVESLEASTAEVVKAIRGAGIYIPG